MPKVTDSDGVWVETDLKKGLKARTLVTPSAAYATASKAKVVTEPTAYVVCTRKTLAGRQFDSDVQVEKDLTPAEIKALKVDGRTVLLNGVEQ